MTEQRFPRQIKAIGSIVEFVNLYLGERGIAPEQAYDVHLVIEELFTNMVKYEPHATEPIALALEWNAPELTIRLRDIGVDRFDVTLVPPVDVSTPVQGRKRGGLGLHFVRATAHRLAYDWTDRVSTITVTQRLG